MSFYRLPSTQLVCNSKVDSKFCSSFSHKSVVLLRLVPFNAAPTPSRFSHGLLILHPVNGGQAWWDVGELIAMTCLLTSVDPMIVLMYHLGPDRFLYSYYSDVKKKYSQNACSKPLK